MPNFALIVFLEGQCCNNGVSWESLLATIFNGPYKKICRLK